MRVADLQPEVFEDGPGPDVVTYKAAVVGSGLWRGGRLSGRADDLLPDTLGRESGPSCEREPRRHIHIDMHTRTHSLTHTHAHAHAYTRIHTCTRACAISLSLPLSLSCTRTRIPARALGSVHVPIYEGAGTRANARRPRLRTLP